MDTLQAINTRRTIRAYTDKEVGEDLIYTIVEAGKYAPTAGNLQNWRCVLVREQGTKAKLADACVQQYWMEKASVHIVVVSDLEKADNFYGDRGKDVYSRHNAAAVVQTMLLAAHEIGLGGAWVGAFDEGVISRILDIPEGQRPEAIVTVGYPAEEVPAPARFPFQACTWIETWGNRFDDPQYDRLGGTGHRVRPAVEEQIKKGKELLKKLNEQLK